MPSERSEHAPREPIIVHLRPLPETRTPTLDCKWRAECRVGEKTYVEVSRAGASHELARTLVNEGILPAAMHIHEEGRPGYLAVANFHDWALWGYEGDRRVLYAKILATSERLKARAA